MRLFRRYIKKEGARLVAEGVRVRFIGGRERLDADLQALMAGLEAQTARQRPAAPDGRDQLRRPRRDPARDAAGGRGGAGRARSAPTTSRRRRSRTHLDTAGLPDPDLILRTSGEYRVSGFLPWQSAYSEFAFVETRWPDFTAEMFAAQVRGFGRRERTVRRRGAMTDAPPRPVRFADLGQRLASGVVLAAIALLQLWAGGGWAAGFLIVVLALMLWEYHRMVTGSEAIVRARRSSWRWLAGVAALVATAIWGPPTGLPASPSAPSLRRRSRPAVARLAGRRAFST